MHKPFENDPELKKIVRKLSSCNNCRQSKIENSKALENVGLKTFNRNYDAVIDAMHKGK